MGNPYKAKADFFDKQVHTAWAAQAYGAQEKRKLERLFAATGSLLGLRVFEPGCGTGRLTAVLSAKVGPQGRVVAIDISPAMVAEARKKLSGCQNVEVLMGTAETHAEVNEKFHVVLCHQVFPHFENPGDALGRLAQMLHPGGRIVISHFMSSLEINDVHRKAHASVANDMIPPLETLLQWCGPLNLTLESWQDDDEGYLFCAKLPLALG